MHCKTRESDTFIFNYGTEIKFCLICREPTQRLCRRQNHNHREGINFKHFPMIQFELNYGLMEYFDGEQIADVAILMKVTWKIDVKKCQQTREKIQ